MTKRKLGCGGDKEEQNERKEMEEEGKEAEEESCSRGGRSMKRRNAVKFR